MKSMATPKSTTKISLDFDGVRNGRKGRGNERAAGLMAVEREETVPSGQGGYQRRIRATEGALA